MSSGRPVPDLRLFAARGANYVERRARTVQRRLAAPGGTLAVDTRAEQAHVLLYFPEALPRAYQLGQWLPVAERLADGMPVACVLRQAGTYDALRGTTSLPLALLPTYDDLMAFYERGYERGGHKVVVYVNHGQLNFQSLTLRTALHVHVNHGESDKRSSFSNQAKAYDRVFVAGEVAARRYLDNVLEFDERRLARVGRPPLDFAPPPSLPASGRPTVLYAPTWEGESLDNNWGSVDRLGVPIVEQLLGTGAVRVAYKPHPRVVAGPDPAVAAAHDRIVRLIAAAAVREPGAGHVALVDGDVLGALAAADLLVTDVSAVGLDYLFLHPRSPIVLTDMRGDPGALAAATPLAGGSDVVGAAEVGGLGDLVLARLARDARREDRAQVHARYFGDLVPDGQSTALFTAEVGDLCHLRDALVGGRVRV